MYYGTITVMFCLLRTLFLNLDSLSFNVHRPLSPCIHSHDNSIVTILAASVNGKWNLGFSVYFKFISPARFSFNGILDIEVCETSFTSLNEKLFIQYHFNYNI